MEDFMMGDYRRSERGRTTTALTFLFLGLGIGAIAAMMMTPKTGKQMRKAVRRRYEDAKDSVVDWQDIAGDAWERGSEWANTAKEKVAPFAKKIRRT